jgi:4-alpha-glucanotransferase
MRILQFGFGDEPDASDHLPHRCEPRCVAYTGTHDTNTLQGWFRGLRPSWQRQVLAYLGGEPKALHRAAVRALLASPASVVIFPLQDVLGLDERARMNRPGARTGCWRWRLPAMKLDKLAECLSLETALHDRPPPSPR